MLLEQKVIMKWNYSNRKYYESMGYIFTKVKDEFEVDVYELPENSHFKVLLECDYCGEKIFKEYSVYNRLMKISAVKKITCGNRECINQKTKECNIANYGVDSTNKLESQKERSKETNIKNFGTEHYLQSEDARNKLQDFINTQYSIENNIPIEQIVNMNIKLLDLKSIKEKTTRTNLERYGVENVSQNKEIQEKVIKTNIERYGVASTLQTKNVQDKAKKSYIEKYGVEHPMKNEQYKKRTLSKAFQSMYQNGTKNSSRQQKYLANLLKGELNFLVGSIFLDIAFPDEKIYIEYDGSGHDLNVQFGQLTKEEFENNETNRFYFLKKNGWLMIKIISLKDYLPDDDKIIAMIEQAREYLKISNSSWIKFHIDEKKVFIKNYEIDYDFGAIRKLKKQEVI